MKKTILLTSLAVMGFGAFAQSVNPAQTIEPPSKPPKVVLLKKVVKAGPAAVPGTNTETARIDSSQVPSEAVLRLPAPVSKVRAQAMAGLGTMPGEANNMRIKSVRVGTDRNELIYISQSQLNKISTPFESPKIIDSTGATLKAVGQDLFLLPSSDKPLTVYISNGGVGQSIGLTLVPQLNLPAQSIVLQPDASFGATAVATDSEETAAGDYVSRIAGLVKSMALGKTPAGFTRGRLPASVVTGNELVIEPQYKYGGSSYDLYSYRVRSVSKTPLELKEEAFYSEAVRAVAFFPTAMLQTGEVTTVFVVADRSAKEAGQ